ncbi:hypothetical protein [Streptomyces sp. SP18BB07]|uniref:hypothetical protein n=1 Tax=Streptomyces sp. SP18BB07 TaxID=3002522 RepID=UPI002E759A49|nr:hypothetical protein [Streptomyces sp. SP18BB07]MEE1764341.1 hypothetical protein [Streptomyces sp. SP18BB07]
MSSIPEPAVTRPWRPEDGPKPVVWTWPRVDPPALWVWANGRYRWATVVAKQVWADDSVVYQVLVDLRGDTTVVERKYRWPQPGLRVGAPEPIRAVAGRPQRRTPDAAPLGVTGPQGRSSTGR